VSISKKRSRSSAAPARFSKSVVFAIGGFVVVAALALVAYYSRPAATVSGAPELGEHLHSLLAYGPQGTILVGTHGATALSTDGGKTLAKIAGLDGIDAMESGADGTGALVVVAGHDGAKVSHDDGKSWANVSGLPGTDIHGFGVDAGNPKHWIAYVVGQGIFETTDAGVRWKPLAAPPADPMGDALVRGRTILFPTMPSGLLRSTDGGTSWRVVDQNIAGMALASAPHNAERLYLSGAGALFASTDGGKSWSQRGLPQGVQVITPMADGTLVGAGYSTDHRAVLVRSRDNGATWSAAGA